MKKLLLLVTFIQLSAVSFSQTQTELLAELEFHYSNNIENLRDLHIDKRALPFSECENFKIGQGLKNILRYYDESTGILIYSYSNDTLRAWLCRNEHDSLRIYKRFQKTNREDLVTAEVNLRRALRVDELSEGRSVIKRSSRQPDSSSGARPVLNDAIRIATQILFPDSIAARLAGMRHLVIVPEFNIGQFPFYIMRPFGNESDLVDSLSISFAPHLCNFNSHKSTVQKAKFYNPLIVGDPLYNNSGNYELPQLKGAKKEAEEIAAMLNAKPITGENASISKVIRAAQNSDLLYFATHGYFDFDMLLDSSFLAFTGDSSNPTGLWTARNIQQERFYNQNALAVLSACQTGVGKILNGGYIGIGRAFFIAGVDHTIMTLWSVDDIATQQLMTSFMRTLLTVELPYYPSGHLRKAILDFKRTNNDPTLWAPFISYGFPRWQ